MKYTTKRQGDLEDVAPLVVAAFERRAALEAKPRSEKASHIKEIQTESDELCENEPAIRDTHRVGKSTRRGAEHNGSDEAGMIARFWFGRIASLAYMQQLVLFAAHYVLKYRELRVSVVPESIGTRMPDLDRVCAQNDSLLKQVNIKCHKTNDMI